MLAHENSHIIFYPFITRSRYIRKMCRNQINAMKTDTGETKGIRREHIYLFVHNGVALLATIESRR